MVRLRSIMCRSSSTTAAAVASARCRTARTTARSAARSLGSSSNVASRTPGTSSSSAMSTASRKCSGSVWRGSSDSQATGSGVVAAHCRTATVLPEPAGPVTTTMRAPGRSRASPNRSRPTRCPGRCADERAEIIDGHRGVVALRLPAPPPTGEMVPPYGVVTLRDGSTADTPGASPHRLFAF